MSENHYKTLGVTQNAGLESIKQAYRQQIRLYHPDTFAPRRNQLQASGDAVGLRALEKEIESAKRMTQRINAAYAVLSDVEARAKYDQQLFKERQAKQEAEAYRQRMRQSDDGRRTVKSRPHRPKTKAENAPWAMAFGFLVFLFIASTVLTNTFFRQEQNIITVNPSSPAREGEITMNDLQATSNSRRATQAARATIAALPTQTPRSAEDNERLGDSMMDIGQYGLAIESYSAAIRASESSNLYTKRGLAYSASFHAGQSSHSAFAFADFASALELDSANALAYEGRAWLYYHLWQESKSPLDAQAARRDFEAYLELVGSDAEAEAALLELND